MPYFLRSGHRVELMPHVQAAAFKGTEAALERLSAVLERAGARVLGTYPETGLLVAEVPPGDKARVDRAVQAARLQGRVRPVPAYSVVGGPPDDLWVPTGRIAVRFPETWDDAAIEATLKRRGLSMREPIEDMPGGVMASADGVDPIEAARALVEEDGAIFADPDFLRRLFLRGNETASTRTTAPVTRRTTHRSGRPSRRRPSRPPPQRGE